MVYVLALGVIGTIIGIILMIIGKIGLGLFILLIGFLVALIGIWGMVIKKDVGQRTDEGIVRMKMQSLRIQNQRRKRRLLYKYKPPR